MHIHVVIIDIFLIIVVLLTALVFSVALIHGLISLLIDYLISFFTFIVSYTVHSLAMVLIGILASILTSILLRDLDSSRRVIVKVFVDNLSMHIDLERVTLQATLHVWDLVILFVLLRDDLTLFLQLKVI